MQILFQFYFQFFAWFSIILDFNDLKFTEIGGSLLELKCRSQPSAMSHARYLECLQINRESVSEAAEGFARSNSAKNDTFDGAADFLFNLVLGLQVTGSVYQNESK